MTTDDEVQAAVFLLQLGGKWTPDCGCLTVLDGTRWAHLTGSLVAPHDSFSRYVMAHRFVNKRGPVSEGSGTSSAGFDATEAVLKALDHDCGLHNYVPVETVPVN